MKIYSKEDYLKNRKKKRYSEKVLHFTVGVSYTIDQVKKSLQELEKNLADKESVDVWIDPAQQDQDDYDSYLMVSWIDWETEEDFEKRMWDKKWAKERAVESLKHLIDRNPQEAVEYIKELNLI